MAERNAADSAVDPAAARPPDRPGWPAGRGRDNPNRTRRRSCCARVGGSGRLIAMSRRIWKELGYALLGFPLAAAGFVYAVLAVPFSGLSLTLLGDAWPRAFLVALVGVLVLLAAPWAVRLPLLPDRLLIRALLGPTARDARVADLERSRAYAVDESAAVLRRIERDLHDGAQARLVAVAMRLGMAREKLGDEVDPGTRELIDVAHRNAKEAIVELRDLARGIHPPALDNGLDAALATLAARSPVPVGLRVATPGRPAPAIETIAYFCVAELLTNVAKHSRARPASGEVSERDGRLHVRVADDGTGGARPGTGPSGLRGRVRTVDGALDLRSPPGARTART